MTKSAWRKKFQLPSGYVQEELFQEQKLRRSPGFIRMFINFLGIVFIVAILAASLTQQIYLMNLNQSIAALEQELEDIHRANESLRLEYTRAENLANIERIALTKLGMVRPVDIVYITNIKLASRE